MSTPSSEDPTVPRFSGVGERRALLAGLAFLDLTETGQLEIAALARWFDEHVVDAGWMPRLTIMLEPPAGTLALRPSSAGISRVNADLPRVITTARLRVVDGLRGLISSPSDDRFLRASIFLGRVRREDGHWVARPEPTAPLSGIVLSLFGVAILSDRPFYDRQMCVCDTCGRVSFDPLLGSRHACSAHVTRMSGLTTKVSAPAPSEPRSATRPDTATTPIPKRSASPHR